MTVHVDGFVAKGFDEVAAVFRRNFEALGDTGAAFAADVRGVPVVDLWGGDADAARGRPWTRDTLQLVFSGTKGLVATCVLMLAERGTLALDDPVAKYWPEFGSRGKSAVSIGDALSHRARLPAVRSPMTVEALLDDRRMAARLADQQLEEDPRAGEAYHALTYGWLCGEVVRRVTNRSVGAFFAEHVAQPLGLEIWIGLPEELESRVSTLEYGPGLSESLASNLPDVADELATAAVTNPAVFPPSRLYWNEPAVHRAEIAAANAIGTARSMARFYACLANGGELDGVRILRPDTLVAARAPRSSFQDPFHGGDLAFGAGFQLQNPVPQFGPAPEAFGHTGAGGSVHGAWPSAGVGFSYAMNQLRAVPEGDPRSAGLLRALHAALR